MRDHCATQPPAPSGDVCGCGWPLHYTDPEAQVRAEAVIRAVGWWLRITVDAVGDFWVPVHWHLAHRGHAARDLPYLSDRYGWPLVTPGTPRRPGGVSPELKR